MFNFFKDEFPLAQAKDKPLISQQAIAICSLIKDLIREKCSSSLKLYIFDSGSCNGCELELQLLFSPLYDLSSYGIEVVYDILEADTLVITGLITENMYAILEPTYERLKEPKEIILIGDCPSNSPVFCNSFALKKDNISYLFTKAFHISGCPPEPLVLLEGLHEYVKNL